MFKRKAIETQSSGEPARTNSSTSTSSSKSQFYRKLKTITELFKEHERRALIQRRDEIAGRLAKPQSPLSKWKYVETETDSRLEDEYSRKSDILTYLPHDLRTIPPIKEKHNNEDEMRRQQLMDRVITQRKTCELHCCCCCAAETGESSSDGNSGNSKPLSKRVIFNSYDSDSEEAYENGLDQIINSIKFHPEECDIIEQNARDQGKSISHESEDSKLLAKSDSLLSCTTDMNEYHENDNLLKVKDKIGITKSCFDFAPGNRESKRDESKASLPSSLFGNRLPNKKREVLRCPFDSQ